MKEISRTENVLDEEIISELLVLREEWYQLAAVRRPNMPNLTCTLHIDAVSLHWFVDP